MSICSDLVSRDQARAMKMMLWILVVGTLPFSGEAAAQDLSESVKRDYDQYLAPLFDHFHRNPELSLVEYETAARMGRELRSVGFDVTDGVGGTGVVAILKNGEGPMVMMRADMDGLPVEEKSGLDNASTATQKSPITGDVVPVMHACGHDVHITSLVGTARYMSLNRDTWGGTLMLIVQPAEERVMGAKAMMQDRLWERFGVPDYALAFHVTSRLPSGVINVSDGSPYAGSDSVDILVHGVGAHGASPHRGKDPIVIGSQIVLALQTLVSREIAPRESGVVTVGSFHSGTKHNIISDSARLQLTVRSTNPETRKTLLDGIRRIATNMGRVAGLPEDKLPEVNVSKESVPPTSNTPELAQRLRRAWIEAFGNDEVVDEPPKGMGAEDFPIFTANPKIPAVYWGIGGTPQIDFDREADGGAAVPSHHSPLFKIECEPAVRRGVESTIVALHTLMGKKQ